MPQEPLLQVNGTAVPFHPIYDHNLVLQMARPAVVLCSLPDNGLFNAVFLDSNEQVKLSEQDRYRVRKSTDLEGIPELADKANEEIQPTGGTIILVISSGDGQEAVERWVTHNDYHFSHPHKGCDLA